MKDTCRKHATHVKHSAELLLSNTLAATALLAEVLAAVTVQGTVFGHEQQVLQHTQQQLGKQNVSLKVLHGKASPADVCLKFHRMQQRLPADEVEALMAATKGELPSLPAQTPWFNYDFAVPETHLCLVYLTFSQHLHTNAG